ncbi:hypothetical protein [Hungatella effluvii]|uniref:Uncharacterized protein n=1 Tax=Hungatella hathewayi TaxID=154046 RepID=A0A3E4UFB2_9FIRM|nr:hypothetical protein DXC39_04790 [Hungatella hathewayi]RGO74695.1 hypothetical protein DXB08_05750 [Hungatella hathewayi]RHM81956.1 hypothetical protein DWZ48_06460 [Hungatella hathewayi]
MGCINYKIREECRILSRGVYVVLGATTDGYKKSLSIIVWVNKMS